MTSVRVFTRMHAPRAPPRTLVRQRFTLEPRRHRRQLSKSSTTRSSVNPHEVAHFNALASSWWDPEGPSRLLHLMNPLRHNFIQSCIASQPDAATSQKLRYLDVGCGGGIFAESAARLSQTESVTAIDPSLEVLDLARAHARRDPLLMQPGRLNYIAASVEELAEGQDIAQGGFDVVTLFEVIEHVSQPSEFLDTLTQHVKPGGWLILSTIARTWTSWITTKVVAEDLLRIVPRGTHDWDKFVNEDEVRRWFQRKGGWQSPRAMGVVYVPGLGWREARGGEAWGNYFFGIRKAY